MCRIASLFLIQWLKKISGDSRDFKNIETQALIRFFFFSGQGVKWNWRHSARNMTRICTIVCHRHNVSCVHFPIYLSIFLLILPSWNCVFFSFSFKYKIGDVLLGGNVSCDARDFKIWSRLLSLINCSCRARSGRKFTSLWQKHQEDMHNRMPPSKSGWPSLNVVIFPPVLRLVLDDS